MSFRDLTPEQQQAAIKKGFVGMVSERETVQDAYNYAIRVAEGCCDSCKVYVMTALQVLVNTYAVILSADEGKESSDA